MPDNRKVQVAVCSCGGFIQCAALEYGLSAQCVKDFAKLLKKGYTLQTLTLDQYREHKGGWCWTGANIPHFKPSHP